MFDSWPNGLLLFLKQESLARSSHRTWSRPFLPKREMLRRWSRRKSDHDDTYLFFFFPSSFFILFLFLLVFFFSFFFLQLFLSFVLSPLPLPDASPSHKEGRRSTRVSKPEIPPVKQTNKQKILFIFELRECHTDPHHNSTQRDAQRQGDEVRDTRVGWWQKVHQRPDHQQEPGLRDVRDGRDGERECEDQTGTANEAGVLQGPVNHLWEGQRPCSMG